jgi:hypothetical protein
MSSDFRQCRSYRCYYHPRPDAPAESGVLPHIQVLASSAEDAARRANAVLGKPVDHVERLEPAKQRYQVTLRHALTGAAIFNESVEAESDAAALRIARARAVLRGTPGADGARVGVVKAVGGAA